MIFTDFEPEHKYDLYVDKGSAISHYEWVYSCSEIGLPNLMSGGKRLYLTAKTHSYNILTGNPFMPRYGRAVVKIGHSILRPGSKELISIVLCKVMVSSATIHVIVNQVFIFLIQYSKKKKYTAVVQIIISGAIFK